MRHVTVLAVCMLIYASAIALPQSPGIMGRWQWRGAAGWQQIMFDFRTNGNLLTGTISMGPGPAQITSGDEYWRYFFQPVIFPISNGRIDGNTITFEQIVMRGAGSRPAESLKYTGKVVSDGIAFARQSIQAPGDPFVLGDHKMEFTAERVGSSVPSPSPPSRIVKYADVSRISLNVAVSGRDGKPVTNLVRDDFHVLEDGRDRSIQEFLPARIPSNVLLMFDHSLTWLQDDEMKASANYITNGWNTLLQSSSRFLGRLDSEDQVAFAVFEDVIEKVDWISPRSRTLGGILGRVALAVTRPPAGQRDVYGAIAWGAKSFSGVKGRKVCVVFTDGRDGRLAPRWMKNVSGGPEVLDPLFGLPDATESMVFERFLKDISGSGVQFFFIAINSDHDPEFGPALVGRRISGLFPGSDEAIDAYLLQTRRRMERLAAVSGGRVFYGDTPKDAVAIFASLHEKLGLGSYSLELSPTEPLDGTYHRIEVRVGNPNFRVSQSLNGYNSQ